MSKHDNKLENAFQFIERGNDLESNGSSWSAADAFGKAMRILDFLSRQLIESIGDEQNRPTDATAKEQLKISHLYRRQSLEYRIRARDCFIKALTLENDEDRKRKENTLENDTHTPAASIESDLTFGTLSAEEVQRRVRIFSCLYARRDSYLEINKQSVVEEATEKDVVQKQDSLEERLKELNATLPSGFKTSKERMTDINRGLSRLGLSLYTQEESPSIEVPASEEEQVQQILAQAKDEAKFELEHEQTSPAENVASGKEVDTYELSSSDGESSDDEQELDSDEGFAHRKTTKAARRRVVKAQIKLAELVALLDVEEKNPPVSSDDASEDDGRQSQSSFDPEHGKKLLISAKICLEKALSEWTEEEK